MAKAEVAIIGGGVIGFSIAYHLAKQGIRSQVIEMDAIAAKASGKAWAVVGPAVGTIVFESELYPKDCLRPCLELARESSQRISQLAAEFKEEGVDIGYGEMTEVFPALQESDENYLRQRVADLAGDGFSLRWAGEDELRGFGLNPKVRGGLMLPHGTQVEAYRYVLALAQAAERLGASIKYGQAVGFKHQQQRVNSVKLASGAEVGAEAVVIAMGPWSAQAASWLGMELPLEAVRGSCLKVEVPQRLAPYLFYHERGQVMPKADGSVIVGYIEERRVGVDDDQVREEVKETMLEGGVFMLPRLSEARLTEARAGVLGYSPDGMPILGRLSGWDNAYIAAGLGTWGINYSQGVGRVMADLIAKDRAVLAIDPLSPARFGL